MRNKELFLGTLPTFVDFQKLPFSILSDNSSIFMGLSHISTAKRFLSPHTLLRALLFLSLLLAISRNHIYTDLTVK